MIFPKSNEVNINDVKILINGEEVINFSIDEKYASLKIIIGNDGIEFERRLTKDALYDLIQQGNVFKPI